MFQRDIKVGSNVRTFLGPRQGHGDSVVQSAGVYLRAVTSAASACELRARACSHAFKTPNTYAKLSLPLIALRGVILCFRDRSLHEIIGVLVTSMLVRVENKFPRRRPQ